MGQGDHSKYLAATIKIPDPVVAFHQFENKNFYIKLQNEIKSVIDCSTSSAELPPDYWLKAEYLLSLMKAQQSNFIAEILKYSPSHEVSELRVYFEGLSSNIEQLCRAYQRLVTINDKGQPDHNQLVADGLLACHNILQTYADRNGILFKKAFQTTVLLLAFASVYRSFFNLYGKNESSRQRKEMECLYDTVDVYKNICIQERLDNIKMLRVKSEEYNVHDYSYQAQIRKDVVFGGVINDYFDRRPQADISFRSFTISDTDEVDRILDDYRQEVKFQYEMLFNVEERTRTT